MSAARVGRQKRRNNSLEGVSVEEIQQLWKKAQEHMVVPVHPDACYEWTGRRHLGRPAVFSSRRGPSGSTSGVAVHAYMLAYYMRHGVVYEEGSGISHLCHNSECTNPNHLVIENNGVNQARRYCLCSTWVQVSSTQRIQHTA